MLYSGTTNRNTYNKLHHMVQFLRYYAWNLKYVTKRICLRLRISWLIQFGTFLSQSVSVSREDGTAPAVAHSLLRLLLIFISERTHHHLSVVR